MGSALSRLSDMLEQDGATFADAVDPEPAGRFRLALAYDGTLFSGWARQPGLRTVQGVLEEALVRIFQRRGPAPTLVVAGRTDAGVHATGQVAHLELSAPQLALLNRRGADEDPAATLRRRLNGILGTPSDVVVSGVEQVAADFDARFSALWRVYHYRIADALAVRDPLQRLRTVWRPGVLDVDAMNAAAGGLLGLRDFAAFCRPRAGATTIRTLQDYHWERLPDGVLEARVQADAFCHSMVRALVGGCVAVGEGRLAAHRLAELLAQRARSNEFVVMPAHGLTLVEVVYPAAELLAHRAEQTRARRS